VQTYETEEQQVEAIKKWFKENGNSLFWTVVITLCVVSGIKYWRHHSEVVRIEASDAYNAMLQAVHQDDVATADSKATYIIENHSKTPYADLATFYQAKAAVGAKDLELAANHLQAIVDNSNISDFQYIARARLARVRLAQGKPEKALALFDIPKESSYFTLLQELKGDTLIA